jgi:hypothetical protein
MGNAVKIILMNKSEENINLQNKRLKDFGVDEKYRFYSNKDLRDEFKYYLKHPDQYPQYLFNEGLTYEEFKEVYLSLNWNELGVLWFDTYFNRTPEEEIEKILNYFFNTPEFVFDDKILGISHLYEEYMNEEQKEKFKKLKFAFES